MIETLNANPNTEQMRKHKLFAALMCLFAAMFFARNVLGVNFPVVLFLVLAVIIAYPFLLPPSPQAEFVPHLPPLPPL